MLGGACGEASSGGPEREGPTSWPDSSQRSDLDEKSAPHVLFHATEPDSALPGGCGIRWSPSPNSAGQTPAEIFGAALRASVYSSEPRSSTSCGPPFGVGPGNKSAWVPGSLGRGGPCDVKMRTLDSVAVIDAQRAMAADRWTSKSQRRDRDGLFGTSLDVWRAPPATWRGGPCAPGLVRRLFGVGLGPILGCTCAPPLGHLGAMLEPFRGHAGVVSGSLLGSS